MSDLAVKFWGTRGSIPVAGIAHEIYGGNTTCLEIASDCLPENYRLIIDAGTGIVPLGQKIKKPDNGSLAVGVLFTHYHHDHTQGLLMMPQLYDKSVEIQLFGPCENGIGPKEVMENLMRPPLFPVAFAEVASHVKCKGIEHAASKVIVSHRRKRPTVITLEELERVDKNPGQQIRLGQDRFDINECLVIRMYRSNHPERTISYRFEDRASGKVLVFLTDHENTDGIPTALKKHLAGAEILIMDSQYTREQYCAFTAGFGHSTPDYCLKVAKEVQTKKLFLTHHDPGRNDAGINQMLQDLGSEKDFVQMAADGEFFTL